MNIHFFDIDSTLILSKSKMCVIDKNKPEQILCRIDNSYIPLMKSYWKKHDLTVTYNGQTYYLNPNFFEQIQDIKKINISNIGITSRDWTDNELIDNNIDNIEYLISNFIHLRELKDIGLNILTARSRKDAHIKFIEELKEKIFEKTGHKINKTYFVNNLEDTMLSDSIAHRKSVVLLESLIGYTISNDKFIDLELSSTNEVHFYDDDTKNIEYARNLQYIFELVLNNTKSETLKEIIQSRVTNSKLYYNINQTTSNKLNRFITKREYLKLPTKK